MAIDHRGEVLFLPADPPRLGVFALWEPAPPGVGSPAMLDVFQPGGAGIRRTAVPARLVRTADALPWLAALPAGDDVAASQRAWSIAVRSAVALVARGRLRPGVSARGFGAWFAGPLDAGDIDLLERLAAAFPPLAHAVPVATDPARMQGAQALIGACWDAVADVMVRTAAAVRVCPEPALASPLPISAAHLRGWLETVPEPVRDAVRLALRVDLSDEDGRRSAVTAEIAGGDCTLPQRLDVDLALHRGARLWPPLHRLEGALDGGRLELSTDEVGTLLEQSPALAGVGVDVHWPASLRERTLDLRAVVGSDAVLERDDAPAFSLEALLDFRWEVTLGRTALSAEEMERLAESGRGLVRLHDGWALASPHLVERLRRRPDERLRAADALAAALTGTVEVAGETVSARADGALARLGERLSDAVTPRDAAEPEGLAATLRAYQRRGLAWLTAMCGLGLGGCLADDMGLGKTVQVIALHLARSRGPMLVVCPASLVGTWEREVTRFAPGLPVRRYHGGARHLDELAPREVVLATYGVARRDRAHLAAVRWDLVVADEAQHMKNPLSRTARELRGIPAAARVALTGTPVENRLLDLWSILDWTTPGLLGPLDAFRRRVAIPVEQDADAAVAERFSRLIRPFVLRRTKRDPEVAPDLPAKTEVDQVVPLTAEQAGLYEAVVRETLDRITTTEGMRRRGLVLKLVTALKQICNHPAHYLRESGPLEGRSGKLDALDELLDVIVAEGESALVFTQYVAMARLLEAHLEARGIGAALLHGGLDPRRRDELVDAFQGGRVPVFLLSLRAGGVGLTLTRATHVVHFDRWWNPAVEDQATDRAHRIGQDRPVEVHRLVTEGTVEDRIAALLQAKRGLAESVVGSGEGWITELSDGELRELVALQRSR